MNSVKQIAIVGCGWLGLPLGLTLQQGRHNIVATARSAQRVNALTEQGFIAIQYELGAELQSSHLAPIFESDILVLNIPVGRKTATPEVFVQHMLRLIQAAHHSPIQHILFISTTSVYGDIEQTVTEASPIKPITASAKVNFQIEQMIKKYFSNNATVLRLAGLIGPDRHPAKFLAGRSNLANPEQVVNLIHQQDVIHAIQAILTKQVWGETLLLCASGHPSRKQYYTWAAKQLNLVPPKFKDAPADKTSQGKQVDGSLTLEKLGLKLIYPSPYDML